MGDVHLDEKETKKSFPKRVYGLARVSTDEQADENESLAGQFKVINQEASSFGVVPIVYDEVGSGGRAWREREVLQQVLREAARENATIMVTAVDRLAREMSVYDELVRLRLPVWIAGRGRITRKVLWHELKAAKAELDRIRRVAAQDHAGKKSSGKKVGGSFSYETSIRGGNSGYLRAGDRDRRMFDLFGDHPEWTALSHQAMANYLNATGIRNVVTVNGGEKDWTRDSMAKLRNRYRRHLEVEAEMDISDGITPLDLHGVHRRVVAASSNLISKKPDGRAQQ
ncbi:recombinase family protein [Loktanella sp. R86503]|uniref:recombinase family protein n=1 Tax=Loktanella sp. R86503 TaxID=3093847 RepID=UPI0036D97FF2